MSPRRSARLNHDLPESGHPNPSMETPSSVSSSPKKRFRSDSSTPAAKGHKARKLQSQELQSIAETPSASPVASSSSTPPVATPGSFVISGNLAMPNNISLPDGLVVSVNLTVHGNLAMPLSLTMLGNLAPTGGFDMSSSFMTPSKLTMTSGPATPDTPTWSQMLTGKHTLRVLSPELRLMIYRLVFAGSWDGKTPTLIKAFRAHPGLYNEALDEFSRTNVYKLHAGNRWGFLDMHIGAIRKIRAIEISMPPLDNGLPYIPYRLLYAPRRAWCNLEQAKNTERLHLSLRVGPSSIGMKSQISSLGWDTKSFRNLKSTKITFLDLDDACGDTYTAPANRATGVTGKLVKKGEKDGKKTETWIWEAKPVAGQEPRLDWRTAEKMKRRNRGSKNPEDSDADSVESSGFPSPSSCSSEASDSEIEKILGLL